MSPPWPTLPAQGLLASLGPAAFAGVFLLTALAILLLPRRLLDHDRGATPPWWRNVRFWAVAICVVQVLVYLVFG
ncbi:MAG: hypothetical protein JXQ71_08580 [Verrucomicrobia bacterium]|nr:hypothetical protein [Verrucomicrobiota bacterium]